MRLQSFILTLTAWAASSSCTMQGVKEHHPGDRTIAYTVRIWIQPDSRIPRAAVMDGCNKWNSERITCLEVDSPKMAKIRVYADDKPCVTKDPRNHDDLTLHTYLAWAYAGGDVKMMMKCMPHDDRTYETREFGAVITHEVGHQLGIWEHVPDSCNDEKVKLHSGDGRKICGTAVMNPHYQSGIDYVTENDAMAFDERDTDTSVLVGDLPKKESPGCLYELPAH
jgi:hypothetical protein